MVYTQPYSHVYIIFTDARIPAEEAVKKFTDFLKKAAIAQGGECAVYEDGSEIPLHFQGFSCTKEQKFSMSIIGDRK